MNPYGDFSLKSPMNDPTAQLPPHVKQALTGMSPMVPSDMHDTV